VATVSFCEDRLAGLRLGSWFCVCTFALSGFLRQTHEPVHGVQRAKYCQRAKVCRRGKPPYEGVSTKKSKKVAYPEPPP